MQQNNLNIEEMTASAKKMSFIKVTKDMYKSGFNRHLHYSLMKDCAVAEMIDYTKAACLCVRDVLALRWFRTQQHYYHEDSKRVYYMSSEYNLGRALSNSLICLGNDSLADEALYDLGLSLEELEENEVEAALGNGGMGRLAACFLDSMATLGVPAMGYGLRYKYGMFTQVIRNGYQYEEPDNWLKYGNPWMVPRPENNYKVSFGGSVQRANNKEVWEEKESVVASPSDIPIPGYRNDHVNTLRLWGAMSSEDFNFSFFDTGDYVKAVMRSNLCSNITRVLYPSDKFFHGKQLRLRQEYVLVSSSLQDIIRRFKKSTFYQNNGKETIKKLHEKVAIQLNNTHPSLAIPELMRILVDNEEISWDEAWSCTVKCFGYTNQNAISDSLEKWPVDMMITILPRHLQIIEKINEDFLNSVRSQYPGDGDKVRNMSLVTEGDYKQIVMAHLCIVGSHVVNGVSELHTHTLKSQIFKDFADMYPGRFINITSGITPRRWLLSCNPELALLITEHIGIKWLSQATELKKLINVPRMEAFCTQLQAVKQKNKSRFAKFVLDTYGFEIDPQSIFDFQVKGLHEYKRQMLNILHIVTMYNRLRDDPGYPFTPRTIMMGGKAAPGYHKAKLLIKLFNNVAAACNSDPSVGAKLNCIFLANYNVSLAEKIMPAADLSEQLSLAGTESCGTGNMKFMLNGALTIGTMDGANVEMREKMGEENFFLFGLDILDVEKVRNDNYHPSNHYNTNEELRKAIEQIGSGYFSPGEPHLFADICNTLINIDPYMVCADYESYIQCQERVGKIYKESSTWQKMVVANLAAAGHFSSDRTVAEYCEKVWNVEPFYGRMKLT